MKRLFIITSFLIVTLQCFSQNHSLFNEYKASANGKEMNILLFQDSTYIFNTYWGTYHGIWEIIDDESDSLYSKLLFYDFVFDTKSAFFFSHISLNDTFATQVKNSIDNSEDLFVTMFDLTGENVPFEDVCFVDSNNAIIDCRYNSVNTYRQIIPINTTRIEMIGERSNLNSYFQSDYSSNEGSIAFIIGPSVYRFYINKELDLIKYQQCHCDDYHSECSIAFKRHKN